MRRALLVTTVLLLAGCSESGLGWSDDWVPPDPSECELLETGSPHVGELEPSAELRIACGRHVRTPITSLALVGSSTWVLAYDWYDFGSQIYRIADRELDEIALLRSAYGPALVVDDQSQPWLFGHASHGTALSFARPDPSATEMHWVEIGSSGLIRRVEIVGATPQLWFDDESFQPMHASMNPTGEWFQTAALTVEGVSDFVSIGLDGEGRQLAYASRVGDDHSEAEIWTFDGLSTKLLGNFTDGKWWPEPIPIAHPNNQSHEHAAFVQGWYDLTLLWPESDESLSVPFSPSIADPSCLVTDRTVATRTSDGRIWLAWALHGHPSCDVPAIEAPTLRLVEIDPEQRQAREAMRVQLDPTHLEFSPDFVPSLSVGLAMTSYADQLALVIADGPEDQRLHLIHVDVTPN